MKRIEPNLLLALATGFGLALLVLTAGTYGRPDFMVRYAAIAIGFGACYVVANTVIERRAVAPPRPMITPELAGSVPWATTIPLLMLIAAAVPVVLPGRDFALLIIVATVLFGLTVRSAMRVGKTG